MIIKYINDLGTIEFKRIIEIDGLMFHDITYQTASYPNQPGVITTDTSITQRYITISYELNRTEKKRAEILRILTKEGYLYANGRRIKCKTNTVSQGESNSCYVRDVVQFVADYPYFEELTETQKPLFGVVNHLSDDFTFPGIFSSLTNGGSIEYKGSARCEPMIYIQVNSVSGSDNMVLSIRNHTTEEAIKLNYSPSVGEVITIDCENRRITSDINGNILKFITNDTFWDGFSFVPGINEIETLLEGGETAVQVTAVFRNKYVEAVQE